MYDLIVKPDVSAPMRQLPWPAVDGDFDRQLQRAENVKPRVPLDSLGVRHFRPTCKRGYILYLMVVLPKRSPMAARPPGGTANIYLGDILPPFPTAGKIYRRIIIPREISPGANNRYWNFTEGGDKISYIRMVTHRVSAVHGKSWTKITIQCVIIDKR